MQKLSNMVVYPPVKNIHKESILRETIFPAKIDNHLKQSAIEKAIYISENLDLNGILAVEMFITNDDQILVNSHIDLTILVIGLWMHVNLVNLTIWFLL